MFKTLMLSMAGTERRSVLYRYLFFDFDGTLYDTVEGITRSVLYALQKRGMDAPLEELRCFAGPPLDEMFIEKYGFSPEDIIREKMKKNAAKYPADKVRGDSRKYNEY
jgi:phosphoglycolate phosphatase-like HAD superfamily hydrolase